MSARRNPLMDRWARDRIAARPPLVLPDDEPCVSVAGRDPDRVLLVGSGPVAGVGVASHALALTGAVARALAVRSGRGASVESIGRPDLLVAEIPGLVDDAHLARYDAVVLVAGLTEAITLTRAATWRAALTAVLSPLQDAAAADTIMLLSCMPPATSVGPGTGLRGALADRWASHLNRVTAAVAADRPRVHVTRLGPPAVRELLPTAACYRAWADQIADVLEPALSRRS